MHISQRTAVEALMNVHTPQSHSRASPPIFFAVAKQFSIFFLILKI
jgi:hypothetical protein